MTGALPDFRNLSAYGEEFIHCHYLGWVLLVVSMWALWRRRAVIGSAGAALVLAALVAALLAMGPVVVLDGHAWILPGDLAIPLPYFLLERVPGFSSLSLLYRFAALPALVLAVMAAIAVQGKPRWVVLVGLLVLAEFRFASPVAGLPEVSPAVPSPAIEALATAPEGGVMNFPVVGGRAYLYEQTVHGKPLAGTLNFPANVVAQRVWRVLIQSSQRRAADPVFLEAVGTAARRNEIRYLVVHEDSVARPDPHNDAVRRLRASRAPTFEGAGVEVYDLW